MTRRQHEESPSNSPLQTSYYRIVIIIIIIINIIIIIIRYAAY